MKTETKQTHTLHVMHDEDNGRYLLMRGGVLIADCGKGNFGKTEAERIVRAVNSHEELLEALKRAHAELDRHEENGIFVPIGKTCWLCDAIVKAEGRL